MNICVTRNPALPKKRASLRRAFLYAIEFLGQSAAFLRLKGPLALLALLSFYFCTAAMADNIPPKPDTYFFDPSHLLPQATAARISIDLIQYERDTSNQIVAAIFPDLPEGESLEDFTQRTAEAWKVGQKGRDNGVILFIFLRSHKMRIEVGYGLEGALPDITAHRIISEEIAPAFKAGDFTTGIVRGLKAIMAATKGEYRGTGFVTSDKQKEKSISPFGWLALLFFGFVLFLVLLMILRNRNGYLYGPLGGSSLPGIPFLGIPFDKKGNRDDDDRGGGFNGGGGGFGGGGASGGW